MASLPASLKAKLRRTNEIPPEEEKKRILEVMREPEQALQEIREKIAKLKAELKSLASQERLFQRALAPFQAALSPFRRLPDDIIREILLACLPTQHNPLIDPGSAPLLLTRISRRTRNIALSTPRLWAAIHIPIIHAEEYGDVRGTEYRMRRRGETAKEWFLKRSGDCGLTISVHEALDDESLPHESAKDAFEAIATSSARWKNVSLECSLATFKSIISLVNEQSGIPRLESFSLTITSDHGHNADPHLVFNSSLLASAPRLRDLRLHNSNFGGLYHKYNVRWAQLMHLSLGSKTRPVRMGSAGHILRLSPMLRTCTLHLLKDDSARPFSAPHLVGISLAFENYDNDGWWDTPAAMSLFADMTLPALERITYDGSKGSKPLLGLISSAEERITHLSVVNLAGPLLLIACLRRCPHLRVLEARITGTSLEAPPTNFTDAGFQPWVDYMPGGRQVAECLLRAFTPHGSDIGPEELCPELEYVSLHDAHSTVYDQEMDGFILMKSSPWYVEGEKKHRRLKGFYLDVQGGDDDVEPLTREQFTQEIDAGLSLSMKFRSWAKWSELAPVDDGIKSELDVRPGWWPWRGEPY